MTINLKIEIKNGAAKVDGGAQPVDPSPVVAARDLGADAQQVGANVSIPDPGGNPGQGSGVTVIGPIILTGGTLTTGSGSDAVNGKEPGANVSIPDPGHQFIQIGSAASGVIVVGPIIVASGSSASGATAGAASPKAGTPIDVPTPDSTAT